MSTTNEMLLFDTAHSARTKRVLIIGCDEIGRNMHQRALQRRDRDYEVCAVYAKPGDDLPVSHELDRIMSLEEIPLYIRKNRVDEAWITPAVDSPDEMQKIQEILGKTFLDIRFFPDACGSRYFASGLSEFLGVPAITLRRPNHNGVQIFLKSVVDFVLAVLALILLAPLLLTVAAAIKFTSAGPVLYRQARHGLHGKRFYIYKFRSMRMHADGAHGEFKQAKKDDNRVTRFGAFIRRTSIDELPQFFNVLKGDMSIVGPRPHAVEHNEMYTVYIKDYMQRHRVKPGITGWAQINGFRGETDSIEKMLKRVQFDMQYIQEWCLWLDIKIIAWTAIKGWTGNNAY